MTEVARAAGITPLTLFHSPSTRGPQDLPLDPPRKFVESRIPESPETSAALHKDALKKVLRELPEYIAAQSEIGKRSSSLAARTPASTISFGPASMTLSALAETQNEYVEHLRRVQSALQAVSARADLLQKCGDDSRAQTLLTLVSKATEDLTLRIVEWRTEKEANAALPGRAAQTVLSVLGAVPIPMIALPAEAASLRLKNGTWRISGAADLLALGAAALPLPGDSLVKGGLAAGEKATALGGLQLVGREGSATAAQKLAVRESAAALNDLKPALVEEIFNSGSILASRPVREELERRGEVLLFRGVGNEMNGYADTGMIGVNWTTSPFKAMEYAGEGGTVYVTRVDRKAFEQFATFDKKKGAYGFYYHNPAAGRAVPALTAKQRNALSALSGLSVDDQVRGIMAMFSE